MALCRKLGLSLFLGVVAGKMVVLTLAIAFSAQSPFEAQTCSALSQYLNSGANTGMT